MDTAVFTFTHQINLSNTALRTSVCDILPLTDENKLEFIQHIL
jgi:hypothetical protein